MEDLEEKKEEGTEVSFSDDINESEDSEENTPADSEEDAKKKKRKKKLIIFGAIAGVILVLIIVNIISGIIKSNKAKKEMYIDADVERRTVKTTITGSSTVEPNDSYDVKTMKSGDIISDFFKEGDEVKKGDKLYQLDDEDAKNALKTAENALKKAEQGYVDAVKTKAQTVKSNSLSKQTADNAVQKALNGLTDARTSYNDQYVKTDIGGKVASVNVKEGDNVNNSSVIATVYDDAYMKIRIPFNDFDAQSVNVGDGAAVTVTSSGDEIYGTVTEKASSAVTANAHTMAVYVTIEVTNPGTLSESDRGSAVVNGVASSDSANFQYIRSRSVTAKTAGTVKELFIAQGDSVYAGEQLAYVEATSAQTALSNSQLSYDDAVLALQSQVLKNDTFSQDSAVKTANLSLDDAKTKLKEAQKDVEDYLIKAPIDGTVVTKTAKAGDTKDSSNSSEALCQIYDLSSLKIKLDIDETDISKIKTGQKAKVTADATEGEFEGEVIKVPVDGKHENGVTTFTIEIQVKDYGKMLPGMNVDVEIIVEEAENVITVPVNSVNRGNIVYVKDEGKKHDKDVTDALKKRREESEKKGSKGGGESNDDIKDIPLNTEIPNGYRVIKIETGLNDNSYIEVKSGLDEGEKVRTVNTQKSSKNAAMGEDDMHEQMEQEQKERMHQMQTGGGVSGGAPGGGPQGGGGGAGAGGK